VAIEIVAIEQPNGAWAGLLRQARRRVAAGG
jgi:hypothetical protein